MKDTLYVQDGQIIVKEKQLNAKPFKVEKLDTELSNNNSFMTIDIETVLIDGKQTPYLICGYSNNQYIHSFASDLTEDAIKTMFNDFITQLLSPKFKYIEYIYAHNFSGFDGILLLKHLLEYQGGKVKPLLFNNKLMSIKFTSSNHKSRRPEMRTLVFKDSYLLLPQALRNLCRAFKVDTMKTNFPFHLTDINYVGEFPSFDKWTGLTQEQYEKIKASHGDKVWSFKEESIKYCQIDCEALYEVLCKFNELVYFEFEINIHSVLTLPALAMRIYKSQFMPKNTLFQLLVNVEQAIRESYTGGAVDVYITNNTYHTVDEKLYYYDVNSLYPTVMSSMEMPIGKPIAFDGDIRSVDPEAFGFFYCKITSPEYMEHPILQRRIKTKDGTRTIAGLGSWTGWVFSEEMDNAIKYGYTFEILHGYKFKRAVIFREYVERMYNLRLKYKSGTPMNLIAKLLMNSLYGKFGMKPEKSIVKIFDQRVSSEFTSLQSFISSHSESIQDIIEVGDFTITVAGGLSMAKYSDKQDLWHGIDVNIAIASAITSGARVIINIINLNVKF
jgi:hypothetical protein